MLCWTPCEDFRQCEASRAVVVALTVPSSKSDAPSLRKITRDYNTYKKYHPLQLLAVYASKILFTHVHTGNWSHVASITLPK